MDDILLSIVIVNYNSTLYLEKCLESIFNSQKDNVNIEVVVVDNASLDKSYLNLVNRFPEIQIIQNKSNYGFSRANNIGIKHTKGQFVLLLNPDTIVEKNTLRITIDYMQEHKEVGIATCMIKLPDGKIDDACHRGFPTPWNSFCHFSGLAGFFPRTQLFNGYHLGFRNLDQVHEIDSCAGAFMMIRRTLGEKLQWLDEDYFWYGEDLDFCFRAKQTGSKIIFNPHAAIMHYKGISSGIKSHSKKLATANKEIRDQALEARFAVMKIFYQKHYIYRYPKIVYMAVLTGIKVVKKMVKLFNE